MATILSFRPSTGAVGRHPSPVAASRWVGARLLAAVAQMIRRERACRELSRLDDRLLRDIGVGRADLADGRCDMIGAWGAGRGARPLGLPGF